MGWWELCNWVALQTNILLYTGQTIHSSYFSKYIFNKILGVKKKDCDFQLKISLDFNTSRGPAFLQHQYFFSEVRVEKAVKLSGSFNFFIGCETLFKNEYLQIWEQRFQIRGIVGWHANNNPIAKSLVPDTCICIQDNSGLHGALIFGGPCCQTWHTLHILLTKVQRRQKHFWAPPLQFPML